MTSMRFYGMVANHKQSEILVEHYFYINFIQQKVPIYFPRLHASVMQYSTSVPSMIIVEYLSFFQSGRREKYGIRPSEHRYLSRRPNEPLFLPAPKEQTKICTPLSHLIVVLISGADTPSIFASVRFVGSCCMPK